MLRLTSVICGRCSARAVMLASVRQPRRWRGRWRKIGPASKGIPKQLAAKNLDVEIAEVRNHQHSCQEDHEIQRGRQPGPDRIERRDRPWPECPHEVLREKHHERM